MRKTAMIRARSDSASALTRSAVASKAPRLRMVAMPRSRSSRKAFMPPTSTICALLAALAFQPTSTMKTENTGSATSSTSTAVQDRGRIAKRMTRGSTAAFSRAGRNRASQGMTASACSVTMLAASPEGMRPASSGERAESAATARPRSSDSRAGAARQASLPPSASSPARRRSSASTPSASTPSAGPASEAAPVPAPIPATATARMPAWGQPQKRGRHRQGAGKPGRRADAPAAGRGRMPQRPFRFAHGDVFVVRVGSGDTLSSEGCINDEAHGCSGATRRIPLRRPCIYSHT
ncbi:hypothetical protein SAMN04244567_03461 [Paracoccus pantotrophus]|nr:hypothetical protein SAMN04244567_03461 [Paracoccus pantotrophus]